MRYSLSCMDQLILITFLSSLMPNYCKHSGDKELVAKTNNKTEIADSASESKGCSGYVHGVRSVNITLPKIPISANSSYMECDWIIVGAYLERVWIRFLKIDLPEPSVENHCDIAYLMFGGYSDKDEKIIHKRFCGRVIPDIYLTSSSSAWMAFVWTGKNGVMMARPVIVETEFTLEVSGNLFSQMIAGVVCFLSLIVVFFLPFFYYLRKSQLRMEFGIWSRAEEMERFKCKRHFEEVLLESKNAAASSNRRKRSRSGSGVRQLLHEAILRRTLRRSRRSYHRVKPEIPMTDVSLERYARPSERLPYPGEAIYVSAASEAIVHCPKSPCLGESNFRTKQNAAILQSILENFPEQLVQDASDNAADEHPKITDAETLMLLQEIETCVDAENDSVMQIPLAPVITPHISKHPQEQRPLASVCNEESFRAIASSNEILCSTPRLPGNVYNRDSATAISRTRLPNQTSVSLRIESGSCQPCAVGPSTRISLDEGENDGHRLTGNTQNLDETDDDDERHRSLDKKVGVYDMLRPLPTDEISKNVTCDFMPLFYDQKSQESNQSASTSASSNQMSDFTFISSLTKSSDFEPEDSMTFDNAIQQFQRQKHVSDKRFSESFQRTDERHKYLLGQNVIFEPDEKVQRTSTELDSDKPVIVVDMQPLVVVSSGGSSSRVRSNNSSAEFTRKHYQSNKSCSNLHLLNYRTYLSNDPGIKSESETHAENNKWHSRHILYKTCTSRSKVNQNVSHAARSAMPISLASHEDNCSGVDRTSFRTVYPTVFHHPCAGRCAECYNQVSIIKYDQMGNPYRETLL